MGMIAAVTNRTMRALLDFAAKRPALRRRAKTLVRNTPVLQHLVSRWASLAQADMIAAVGRASKMTGPAQGFADRERVLAVARTIIARHHAEHSRMPVDGGPG
jgi:hypothetical protein